MSLQPRTKSAKMSHNDKTLWLMRRKEKTKYSAKRDGDRADFDIACNLRKQKTERKSKSYMTRAISAIMDHSQKRMQRTAPLLLSVLVQYLYHIFSTSSWFSNVIGV